jgi:hypothetical protein
VTTQWRQPCYIFIFTLKKGKKTCIPGAQGEKAIFGFGGQRVKSLLLRFVKKTTPGGHINIF